MTTDSVQDFVSASRWISEIAGVAGGLARRRIAAKGLHAQQPKQASLDTQTAFRIDRIDIILCSTLTKAFQAQISGSCCNVRRETCSPGFGALVRSAGGHWCALPSELPLCLDSVDSDSFEAVTVTASSLSSGGL